MTKHQMELYLRWWANQDQEPGDYLQLGMVLCTSKKYEQIELLALDRSGIHTAEYLTVLPLFKVLQQKIRDALPLVLAQLSGKSDSNGVLKPSP